MSEQVGLSSLHTLFLREHNRIAEVLHRLNPHWNDEIIYQNTRKIFTATYQQIVYNEFLPRILGWDAMDKYDLRLSSSEYYKSKFFFIVVVCNQSSINSNNYLCTLKRLFARLSPRTLYRICRSRFSYWP